MPKCRLVLATAAQVLLACAVALAQSSSIGGRVVDPQGASVANAEVTVLVDGSQRSRTTRSAADGSFAIDNLPGGSYTLLVRAPGFAEFTQSATASATPLTVALQVAGLTDNVTVQGALLGTAATGKTNLPMRDLPMTVQSVTAAIIQEQGANDLVTALQNVPGVYAFTNYGIYEGYTFRGFLDLFPSLANQLVDGVRHEGNRINSQLTNIERVEVLKGPSSALYGGGAIGATVNLIRKKPSPVQAYDMSVAGGSWTTARATFGATGRLSEKTLYRFDVGGESKEGYRHNNPTRIQVSPSLAWRLGDGNQINAYYTFNRDRFDGDAGIPLLPGAEGDVEDFFPDIPRDRNFRTPVDFGKVTDHNLQVAYARQINDSWGFRNTLSYRPVKDDYLLAEFLFVEDDERTVFREFLQFTHHRKPLSNLAEVTARFAGPIAHDLVFGWEGQHYRNDTDTIPGGGVADATAIDLFAPVETQTDFTRTIARVRHFTHNTNAFYAQDHLTLAPNLKAMVGGRIDVFRRSTFDTRITNGVETETPVVKRDAEALTGRIGVVYQPTTVVDLYGSVANSFRPLTQAQPDGTTLEPEGGRQIEFGQRFHFLNDRLQLNTAVFHIVRTNVAFSRPGGFFDQASEVKSRGFEADVTTSPVSNWRINGGYAFTDAEFGDFLVNATTNLSGNTSIMAPKHTFSVWTAYDWPNGFGVNAGVQARSKVFIDDRNTLTFDGYGTLNVGARYRRGPVEYALNVNNLTDTAYFASVLYDTQLYPGEPINVLGTVRIRFR
jgi:iron complex outermembrane recepter protein